MAPNLLSLDGDNDGERGSGSGTAPQNKMGKNERDSNTMMPSTSRTTLTNMKHMKEHPDADDKKHRRKEHVKDRKRSREKEERSDENEQKRKEKTKRKDKKSKKRPRTDHDSNTWNDVPDKRFEVHPTTASTSATSNINYKLPFDHRYVLAPMVGASELPFRLLCRKYGAQLAYTPMMNAHEFATNPHYRREQFTTTAYDRPLVCHFGCNSPNDFSQCVTIVHKECDAVDLNLGCPQRTAYVGHFGSYLLDPGPDRQLICDIVKAGVAAVHPPIPIFVKIRLLNQLEDTIELCQQLKAAGASLIAIHARFRAGWERKGPGARDGPALLDQVAAIRQAIPDIPIITNGNTITYQDVVDNLQSTHADGLMSAEGILDNPALFLPRLGMDPGKHDDNKGEGPMVSVVDPLVLLPRDKQPTTSSTESTRDMVAVTTPCFKTYGIQDSDNSANKKRRKLLKKLREIERIQDKMVTQGEASIDPAQKEKLDAKPQIEAALQALDRQRKPWTQEIIVQDDNSGTVGDHKENHHDDQVFIQRVRQASSHEVTTQIPLSKLYSCAIHDRLKLAQEYLTLAQVFGPIGLRTVIFHIRRMLKQELTTYQLMDDCLACTGPEEITSIVAKIKIYRDNPGSFVYDRDKAKRQKEALERKQHEEGKRKRFEQRMIRKAKREGRVDDLEHYLRKGAEVPTVATVQRLKTRSKEEQLQEWKPQHSQHCLAFHLDPKGCQRARTCAFLHVDAVGGSASSNTQFDESEELAG